MFKESWDLLYKVVGIESLISRVNHESRGHRGAPHFQFYIDHENDDLTRSSSGIEDGNEETDSDIMANRFCDMDRSYHLTEKIGLHAAKDYLKNAIECRNTPDNGTRLCTTFSDSNLIGVNDKCDDGHVVRGHPVPLFQCSGSRESDDLFTSTLHCFLSQSLESESRENNAMIKQLSAALKAQERALEVSYITYLMTAFI